MSKDKSATKAKIMETTIRLLLENPPETITVRQIAEQAGVNSAAINYHFGSKDQLIMLAVDYSIEAGSREQLEFLTVSDVPPRERLYNYLTHYIKGLFDSPGPARLALTSIYNDRPGEEIHIKEGQRKVSAGLGQTVAEFSGCSDPKKLEYGVLMLISTINSSFLAQSYIRREGTFDFTDAEEREELISFLIESLLKALE